MNRAFDIADSTDWLGTPLAALAPLDAALRCQVCKDLFETPMMTSCSHTFCSLCIRRCLAADGRCPACRAGDDASRLRRNWTVQEVVDAFAGARAEALAFARRARDAGEEEGRKSRRNLKRKRGDFGAEDEEAEQSTPSSSQRQTRSQTKKAASMSAPTSTDASPAARAPVSEVPDSDVTEDEVDQPEDGLVPCPICNKRMKEEAVFAHLDQCDGGGSNGNGAQSRSSAQPFNPLQRAPPSRTSNTPPLARLPQLNYSLLSETALRKKLKELGIPVWGAKALLIRRHTEWINLFNSNCDSARPRSKRDLLQELDTWERSQGGHARDGPATVMKKDFDGKGWMESNSDQFKSLIASARARRGQPKAEEEKAGEEKAGEEKAEDEKMEGAVPTTLAVKTEDRANGGDVEMVDLVADSPLPPSDAAPQGEPPGVGQPVNAFPPYDNNEEALSRVREKVQEANQNNTDLAERLPEPLPKASEMGEDGGCSYPREPSELPAQMGATPSKRVPMFTLPEDPTKDIDSKCAS